MEYSGTQIAKKESDVHAGACSDPTAQLTSALRRCTLCSRRCGIDRIRGAEGPCGAGRLPRVARWVSHRGEEPPLSGTNGSGTIFFTGCSLRCVFCQNHAVSQGGLGQEVSVERLARIMLELQQADCHNVNLVSPTHYAPQIALAIDEARRRGLRIPIVYNSHGYDSPEALGWMKGRVDIYLPDMKYADDRPARELSGAAGYGDRNREAVHAMWEQVGHLREEEATGLAVRGLMVRILVLPGLLEGARETLRYLWDRYGNALCLSLMAQYAPVHEALAHPPLNRTLAAEEYACVVDLALSLGFERLWVQEPSSAHVGVPDFEARDPFRFEP